MARPEAERLTAAFRHACEQAGVTQEQLAERLGVHQTTVSTWLLGKAQPPLRHLPAIDELCGQPKGHVLRLAGYVDDVDVKSALASDPSLDPDGRGMVVRLYEMLQADAQSASSS